MKLSEIYFNHDLYPRQRISHGNVSRLTEALAAGAIFPPVIVDKNGRGVDGAHRCEIYRKAHGVDFEIEVEVRKYKSDKDFALDAVRINNEHGLQLSDGDRTHCELLLQALGFEVSAISQALGKVLSIVPSKPVAAYEGKRVPLKPAYHHLAGQQLTPDMADANRKANGHTQIFTLNQVLRSFETGTMRKDSPKLNELIGRLYQFCGDHLAQLEQMAGVS